MSARHARFVFAFLAAALAGAGLEARAAVLWFTSDPAVVRVGAASGPKLRFQLDGAVSSVAIAPYPSGTPIPFSHEGGNVWSATLTTAQALAGYVNPRVNENWIGYLQATTGGTTQNILNVVILVADEKTPPVPIVQLSPSARRTSRIVNVLMPETPLDWSLASGRAPAIVSPFLASFGDEYDFVQIVFATPQFPQNRYHSGVRSAVTGIGQAPYDVGSTFGSAARLQGYTMFPNLTFFNGAEEGTSHEIGHQWINFSTHPLLHPGTPHWPPSTMARGIMGLSIPGSGAGGNFPYEIQQSGGSSVWKLTGALGEFNDIDLYYMGFLPPADVSVQSVAGDPTVAACDGCPVAGGVKTVSISEVVSSQGARSPDAASTRRTFRIASVVVSRERLLTDDEMSFLDAMAARGEATTRQLVSMGVATSYESPWRLATRGRGTVELRIVPAGSGAHDAGRVVPVVLDVTSTARYTTELSLRNLLGVSLPLSVVYTASLGSGTGTVGETLAPGEQRVIPDAVAWLRSKGLTIPASGSQAGTLAFYPTWSLPSPHPLAVTARTTSPVSAPLPAGVAGLAYGAPPPSAAFLDSATIYGLRQNDRDRSNVAIVNPGVYPVTVRVTAVSGDTGARTVTRAAVVVPAGGWKQIDGALAEAGYTNGWVVLDRAADSSGTFTAYGVVNDNVTNDGSFVQPVGGTFPGSTLTLPVLVEGPVFRSELVLANRSSAPVTFKLDYKESAKPERGAGGSVTVVLQPGIQRIIPEAVDYLRRNGAVIGASGGETLAGAVRVTVTGAPLADVFVGARTAAQVAGTTGQFGLFYGAVPPGREAGSVAVVPGLRAGATLRSNVAAVNAGSNDLGAVTLEFQTYDGTNGSVAWGAPVTVTLQPGQWAQPLTLNAAAGPASASVRVRRTAGTAPWIAYGVVNDGGAPGERTGDGAFVEMVVP